MISPSKVKTLTTEVYSVVTENLEKGVFVAHLSVSDADSGPNGEYTCQVSEWIGR